MDIIINVDALQCQAPVINSVTYTGTQYLFTFNWSSQGNVYIQTNPETTMTLRMQIFDPTANIILYDDIIDSSAPFNTTTYQQNVLNYREFSTKYRLTFTLVLSNSNCTVNTTYVIPPDTIT